MPLELDPAPTYDDGPLERLIVVTPPTSRPVTWAEAKAQCRINSDTEQTLVEGMIDAAVEHAQDAMACSLMQRTLQVIIGAGDDPILPRGPILSIVSIVDADDDVITAYRLEHAGRIVRLIPTESVTYPLTITYTAGHTSAAAIPANIRLAIKQHVATLYENRESVTDKAKTPVPHALQDFYRLNSRAAGVG